MLGSFRACTSLSPISVDRLAMEEFWNMAVGTNPIFLLAAKVIVMLLNKSVQTLDAKCLDVLTADEDACWSALQDSWAPLKHAWKVVWWEGIAIPDDVDDEAAFVQDLQYVALSF